VLWQWQENISQGDFALSTSDDIIMTSCYKNFCVNKQINFPQNICFPFLIFLIITKICRFVTYLSNDLLSIEKDLLLTAKVTQWYLKWSVNYGIPSIYHTQLLCAHVYGYGYEDLLWYFHTELFVQCCLKQSEHWGSHLQAQWTMSSWGSNGWDMSRLNRTLAQAHVRY